MAGKTSQTITANSSVTVESDGKQKTYSVKLPKLKGENAQQTEFFSINGRNYLLERGVTIEVSEELYEVIRNSQAAEEEAERFTEQVALREPKA